MLLSGRVWTATHGQASASAVEVEPVPPSLQEARRRWAELLLEFLARVASHIPNTYKASLVKRTDFDNTGLGGPHFIKRLQHRAVLTSISKSVQMSAPNTYRGSSMQERTNRSLRPRNSSVPSYRPTQTPTSSISGMVS